MTRPDRIFGPVIWISVFHGGIGVRDIISIPWRRSWRSSHGHGFGVGADRGSFGWYSGGLEGLVLVAHRRLRHCRLGSILGVIRAQAIIELHRTSHQGILI